MAEANKETKIRRGQNSRRSAAIPPNGQKMTWPEVVGLTGEEAERIIKEEKPGVRIEINSSCHITCDYKLQRVRIFVDSAGKVLEPPAIG